MSEPPLDAHPHAAPAAVEPDRTPLQELRAVLVAVAGELLAAATGSDEEPAGRQAGHGDGLEAIVLERPRRAEFGDYSTNAALLLAPRARAAPRELAGQLGDALAARLGEDLDRYEVAGPGFLNLFVGDSWLRRALAAVLAAGEGFGAGAAGRPERVLVEFVSANPTGPMHVGHARNAAYGDALARILSFHGHDVGREFYVNDAGTQVRKLGESIVATARGEPVPEDGYRGEYVKRLVDHVPAQEQDPVIVGRAAVRELLAQMRDALAAFAVAPFDSWVLESSLHEGHPSAVERTLQQLEELGRTYRSEGALWLRTTDFGDDKDRVLIRSDGEHTYFASDIAYQQDKRERGFDRQLNVWGADHHGYVRRMKAACEALGEDPDHLELLIMQLVHLVRSGERAQMSKRAGEFVTLADLVEEIGVDAARWYLLARSHETTVDLDLDLAREQSSENPVYYVQYAHARIASMLVRAGAARVAEGLGSVSALEGRDAPPLHPAERALIEQLLEFPGEVAESAERRGPHRIAAYALTLAQEFTAFYRDCRVVGAEPVELESFRLALSSVTRQTIARCLDLLGVRAPQSM